MISIVIPSYNCAKYLSACIESVLSQSFSDWELIIVDDGSDDDTPSIAEDYASRDQRIRFIRQSNSGPSAARNNGFRQTDVRADHLIFLDSDDVWHRDALSLLQERLNEQPQCVACQGLARSVNESGSPTDRYGNLVDQDRAEALGFYRQAIVGSRIVDWPSDQPTTFGTIALRCHITTPGTVLIRRSAFEASGGFDRTVDGAEDWDLWLRLCRVGNITFLNRVVLDYRSHGAGVSSNTLRRALHSGYAIWKAFLSLDNTPTQHQTMLIAVVNYLRRNMPAADWPAFVTEVKRLN